MRALHREGLTAFLLLIGLLPAWAALGADGLAFLPPEGCLPADGGPPFWVHVYTWGRPGQPSAPRVEASRGRAGKVEQVQGGLYRFRFHPPRLDRAGTVGLSSPDISTRVELPLCPHPAGRIEVETEPEHLLAGQGQKAFMHIRAFDPKGRPLADLPLELTVNVGRIESFSDMSEGRYRAVYEPPGDPYPQVAIIMVANPLGARLDRVAVARVVIPITARVELPGKTAPGTRVQMRVAGRSFGPVRADGEGRFSLPILVPPGYSEGRATSIDRAGNRKTRTIDLYLPQTNQLGLWAYPRKLPADGRSRSRLLVTTITPFGTPRDLGGVSIHSRKGRIGALRHLATGLYEAYYTAPESVGSGSDRIEVAFPGGGSKSRAAVDVKLLPGPAARVELRAPELLPADGKSAGALEVRVSDARGNPVGRGRVTLTSDQGEVRSLIEVEPGLHGAELVVKTLPDRWVGRVRVQVKDRLGNSPDHLMVEASGIRTEGEGSWALEAVLADSLGLPVQGGEVSMTAGDRRVTRTSDEFGRVRFPLQQTDRPGPRRCLLGADRGRIQRQVYWVVEEGRARLLDIGLDEALPPAAPLTARADVQLHPPAAVRVAIRAAAGDVKVRITDLDGNPLANRRIRLSASKGELGRPAEVAPGEFAAEWNPGRTGWSRAVLSAVDLASGVGAVVTVVEGRATP